MTILQILLMSSCFLFSFGADAKGGKGGDPNYGGGKYTSSHDGRYQGGKGSSHQGGSYKNDKTDDQYGKHK